MKRHDRKGLTFGDLIASVYDACGRRKARALVRFAVNARLIEFLGPRRFVISKTKCLEPL